MGSSNYGCGGAGCLSDTTERIDYPPFNVIPQKQKKSDYKIIGPNGLERHLGEVAGKFFFSGDNYCGAKLPERAIAIQTGIVEYNSEGELCIINQLNGEITPILHGDAIRLKAKIISGSKVNRGYNLLRSYIFIDDSD